MPGTTPNNAFRYPLSTEAPDGPGAFLALATDLDNILVGAGSWTPAMGGAGATLGTGATVEGSYTRIGKHVSAKGRFVFGTGASFGSGSATVTSLPGGIVVPRSSGHGAFVTGTARTPVFFVGLDSSNVEIRPVRGNASGSLADLAFAFAIGTPASGSELRFALDLTLV